jgi:hypothetical protein
MDDPESNPPPPQPSAPKISKAFFKSFLEWFWNFVGIKSAGESMTDHALTVERKGRFLASACAFLIICVTAGIGLRGCYDKSAIGQAEEKAQKSRDLAEVYKSQFDTANDKIIQLKIDANETKREKDVEIGDLTTENLSLKNRITSYESAHVWELSSNFDSTFSNMLSKTSAPVDTADEGLLINGIWIQTNYCGDTLTTNFQIIPVKNREIDFTVENIGTVTAQHSCLNFIPIIPFFMTNVVSVPNYWRGPFPQTLYDENRSGGDVNLEEICPGWIVEATHSDPPQSFEPSRPVLISTNFPTTSMAALIRLYSDNSKMKEFQVIFDFQ